MKFRFISTERLWKSYAYLLTSSAMLLQLLRPVCCDAGYLLPPVLLRPETCKEHPGCDARGGQQSGLRGRGRGHGARPAPAAVVPSFGPQGGHHGGRHHGRLPRLLGALLLCQYRRCLLQNMHPRYRLQG